MLPRPWLPLAVLSAALPPGLPGQDEEHVEDLFLAYAREGEDAAEARRRLLAEPDFALPVLTRHLERAHHPRQRGAAARLLGMLGERGLPALDGLLEAVRDPAPPVATAALAALAEVGAWAERDTRKHLQREVFALLRGPNAREDLGATDVLRAYYRLSLDPRMTLAHHESLFDSENPLILEYLCVLAGRRGPGGSRLLPRLVRLLDVYKVETVWVLYPNADAPNRRLEPIDVPGVRRGIHDAAAEAILGIDPDSEAAAHVYVKRIHESLTDLDAQRRAVIELGRLGADARPGVHTLVELLETGTGRIRWEAATALGAIGPAAGRAVPALERATVELDPDLRERARLALRQIRGR